jgi:hypothetical protein
MNFGEHLMQLTKPKIKRTYVQAVDADDRTKSACFTVYDASPEDIKALLAPRAKEQQADRRGRNRRAS